MRCLMLIIFSLFCFNVNAQTKPLLGINANDVFKQKTNDASEGVQSFSDKDAWRDKNNASPLLPEINAFLGDAALENIISAEQVFCYTVEKKEKDYKGYTLDGFAITGFCGIINENLQKRITTELFATPKNVLINQVANCSIEPQAIIRFARGVDYTDVLLSSPCYSFAIFYANKLKAFNAEPAQRFIKSLLSAFEKKRIDFISPTQFKQTLPIGRTFAEDEKDLQEVKEVEKAKGWNNLSF